MKKFNPLYLLPFLVFTACDKDDDTAQPTKDDTTNAIVLTDINQNTILEDRFEDAALPDYFVNDDISVNARLTIRPGVVIAFAQDVTMLVAEQGELIARGDSTDKVLFVGKLPQTGYWAGIDFYSISSANQLMDAAILHAGSSTKVDSKKAALYLMDDARLSVKRTKVAQSGGYGLYLRDGSNLTGFETNTFSYNAEAPILLMPNHVPHLDAATVFTSGNGRNVVEVMRDFISGPTEAIWPAFNDQTPYRLLGKVTAQTGWKLLPGTTIEVAPNEQIEIGSGYLNAIGTSTNKITIRGVDQTTGSWQGMVVFSRSSQNIMEHVEFKHAGGLDMMSGVKAGIAVIDPASLNISNSLIANSGGYGIHVYGQDAIINSDVEISNTFTANALAPVFYDF